MKLVFICRNILVLFGNPKTHFAFVLAKHAYVVKLLDALLIDRHFQFYLLYIGSGPKSTFKSI